MLFFTHVAGGLLLSLFMMLFISPDSNLIFLILVIIGSLLPDIDCRTSKVGKNKKVHKLVEHRGIFHSILMAFLLYLLVELQLSSNVSLGFLIGYISHILLDGMTKKGVFPFYPLKLKVKGNIKTGSLYEYMIFFASCSLALFMIIVMRLLW